MFTLSKLKEAHHRVKSGADFKNYIQEIQHMGVLRFTTWTHDSHTIYEGEDGYTLTSRGLYAHLEIAKVSNADLFAQYLKSHQESKTDYITFCKQCAETGVEKWIFDLKTMTCTYYNTIGEAMLVEHLPQA